jgi:membrane associated rhomboid family serine protease
MTIYIIVATVIISLLCFNNHSLNAKLIFNPYLVKHYKEWYRMVTSGFQHADFLHLFINMFVLLSFGRAVEDYYALAFGTYSQWIFLLLYISAIFAANVSTLYKYQNNSAYNALGASGAVSAVVFTSILFNPFNKIYLYGIIGLPGIVWAVIYVGYSYYMGQKQNDNINHDAHLWGGVFGLVFSLIIDFDIATRFFDLLSNPQF